MYFSVRLDGLLSILKQNSAMTRAYEWGRLDIYSEIEV